MSSSLHPPFSQALVLDALSRRFGRRWALRNVSLVVHPGEAVGVLGHNGSGKSTLLRVLATALRPSRGAGRVFGYDLTRDANSVRAVTGLLAHSAGLYDDLTATENLDFAATMLGLRAAPVGALLERVGLGREAHTRVRGFSAGMQRRVALARLMLQRPRLLLLDEPYNSFDAEGVALVNALISETSNAGGAVLIVLHEVHAAEGFLDRTVEMNQGALLTSDLSDALSAERQGVEPRVPLVVGGGR